MPIRISSKLARRRKPERAQAVGGRVQCLVVWLLEYIKVVWLNTKAAQ